MNPRAKPVIVSHPIQLQRLGLVMEPEPSNPIEADGGLNPASALGRDGQLTLFPRLVAKGKFSRKGRVYKRIGVARLDMPEHLPI